MLRRYGGLSQNLGFKKLRKGGNEYERERKSRTTNFIGMSGNPLFFIGLCFWRPAQGNVKGSDSLEYLG